MPRDSKTDQASERAPRDPAAAHLRLLLSGDLESPQQVLAATNLGPDRKREIFKVWLHDLDARSGDEQARRLIGEIHEAIAMLANEEKPKR